MKLRLVVPLDKKNRFTKYVLGSVTDHYDQCHGNKSNTATRDGTKGLRVETLLSSGRLGIMIVIYIYAYLYLFLYFIPQVS